MIFYPRYSRCTHISLSEISSQWVWWFFLTRKHNPDFALLSLSTALKICMYSPRSSCPFQLIFVSVKTTKSSTDHSNDHFSEYFSWLIVETQYIPGSEVNSPCPFPMSFSGKIIRYTQDSVQITLTWLHIFAPFSIDGQLIQTKTSNLEEQGFLIRLSSLQMSGQAKLTSDVLPGVIFGVYFS